MSDYDQGFQDGLAAANAVAFDLETRWRTTAAQVRCDGAFNSGWPFNREFIAGKFEQLARDTEAAADGIKAIRSIVSGLKPTADKEPPK